jgi:CRISPR/Cas system-associated exonuclease Cas4 (RecB family)
MRDHEYIRVSELRDFVYCPVAWQLWRSGASSDPRAQAEQEPGREFHHEHARQLARSDAAEYAATWLAVVMGIIDASLGIRK